MIRGPFRHSSGCRLSQLVFRDEARHFRTVVRLQHLLLYHTTLDVDSFAFNIQSLFSLFFKLKVLDSRAFSGTTELRAFSHRMPWEPAVNKVVRRMWQGITCSTGTKRQYLESSAVGTRGSCLGPSWDRGAAWSMRG